MGSLAVEAMEGVEQTVAISKSYKLASREFHPANTVVDVDETISTQMYIGTVPCVFINNTGYPFQRQVVIQV